MYITSFPPLPASFSPPTLYFFIISPLPLPSPSLLIFQLEKHDSAGTGGEEEFRSLQDMEQEAAQLAAFFTDFQ